MLTLYFALWLLSFFRFLANVLFAVARPSVVCLSVCLSSVTLVRRTRTVQIFGIIMAAL